MDGIWIVDAFATRPFTGNPAGICLLDTFFDDTLLQQIAMEMNLPETAFAVKTGPLAYRLRWFTPIAEVNLCGHATLATTHVLLKSGLIAQGDTVTYDTLGGKLSAKACADNRIELDFPSLPGETCKPPAALKALGVSFSECFRNRDNYLITVADAATLAACAPNFRKLAKLDAQGVIVTTDKGAGGFDFASRYFAPGIGIDEDPVTGSAHCFLAPFWAKRLGKTELRAVQLSRRRGTLDLRLNGERVLIGGGAVITLKGQLQISSTNKKERVA